MTDMGQLVKIRQLVESDHSQCAVVIQNLIHLAEDDSLASRRWFSLFLLDSFTVFNQPREELIDISLKVLTALKELFKNDDSTVLKNSVQVAANLYPLVFLHYCRDMNARQVWKDLEEIKVTCLKLWDIYKVKDFGVEAACIKFAQQVVKTQTYGSRDPRLDDISLSSIPTAHPLYQEANIGLNAESDGLLDRILNVFFDKIIYSPRVSCTIHAVSALIRSRPELGKHILHTVLQFDTSVKDTGPGISSTQSEMEYKFVDRALRLFLGSVKSSSSIMRKVGSGYHGQIEQYLQTLSTSRASENLKKRLAENEEDTSHKRVKLDRSTTPVNSSTTMPAGPVSYTTLFSLLEANDVLERFDCTALPPKVAVDIAFAGLRAVNGSLLKNSVDIIQQRLQNLQQQAATAPTSEEYPVDSFEEGDDGVKKEEDDDEMLPTDDEDDIVEENLMSAADFKLPEPQALTPECKRQVVNQILDRLNGYGSVSSEEDTTTRTNVGLDRLAISGWTKDTWIVFASRLLTRGVCSDSGISKQIRKYIFNYVMQDYRERLEVILTWLTEEWYNEVVVQKSTERDPQKSNYYYYVNELLDTVIGLTEQKNMKVFLRLLSDLPELSKEMVGKLRALCIDPDRLKIGFNGLKFLIMLRPPCRDMALDLVKDLYQNGDSDAKEQAQAILKKFAPDAL